MSDDILLDVDNLQTHFFVEDDVVKAVDGVSFQVESGQTLGIVGESGSGKSVTSTSIMRLVPDPPGKIVNGKINFAGEDLLDKSGSQMRNIRGNDISMIFQEPMTSLNPVYTVGDQIGEAIRLHQNVDKKEALERATVMLDKVGIPSAEQRVTEYPYQLSGGMRQRVMIAMALSCNPQLLIADEPTTALDVTIQAQILELMNELQVEFNTAIMLITHNLGVIAELADEVAVMYAGRIVEQTDVKTLFKAPQHPYTIGLIESIPKLNVDQSRLQPIKGNVPDSFDFLSGCKFANRCDYATEKCYTEEPKLKEIVTGHTVRCWHYKQLELGA